MAEAHVTVKLTLAEVGVVRAALETMTNHIEDELNDYAKNKVVFGDEQLQEAQTLNIALRVLTVLR